MEWDEGREKDEKTSFAERIKRVERGGKEK
jgi:hypothetical protein